MILYQVMRVIVCAAIIALCVAGAGLFPGQSAAGQETGPLTLRGADKQAVEFGKLPENSPPESVTPGNPAKPGREPESRAKTKTLHLRWDMRLVGNIRRPSVPPTVKQQTGAGVAAL